MSRGKRRTAVAPAPAYTQDGRPPVATNVEGATGQLADPQAPAAHHATHENGGSDELSVAGLSGVLADPQTPAAHTHVEADVTGLVADLAARELLSHKNAASGYAGLDGSSKLTGSQQVYGTTANTAAQGNDSRLSDARTPTAHASSHASGGSDVVTLAESHITNLVADLAATEKTANKNAASGYAGLDGSSKLTGSQQKYGTAANTAAEGNDARLSDARTPTAHATSHKSGGSDAIKLDELAAPTDVTTLNASTSAHGLAPKLPGGTTTYYRADGAFATPPGTGGGWTVISNSDTGAQNNWAPTGLSGNTLIEWNGAADAAITGLAGGSAGQIVTVKNVTTTKIATFAHASGSSSAGNKFKNIATSAATPIAPTGALTYQHDGTEWQLDAHEQGALITAPFSAGDYTPDGGTWTVEAGDVLSMGYKLDGRRIHIFVDIGTTTVSGTLQHLRIGAAAWGGFTLNLAASGSILAYMYDAANVVAVLRPHADANKIDFGRFDNALLTAATNLVYARGVFVGMVT